MSKRKIIVRRIAVALLIVLLVSTFASRTVQNIMRPKVTTALAEAGTISNRATATGQLLYPNAKSYTATGDWKLLSVEVRREENVKAGDLLCNIDTSVYDRAVKEMELDIFKLERQRAQEFADWELIDRELELLYMDYNALLERIPPDGQFFAPIDGRISYIAEDEVRESGVVVTIIPPDTKPFAEWYMDGDTAKVFDETARVRMTYNAGEREENAEADIWEREQQSNGTFRFRAQVNVKNNKLDGQNVYVTMSMPSPTYDFVAPETAIFTIEGKPYIFVRKTRKGVFGEEAYVERHAIAIQAQKDGKVAFTCDKLYYTDRLVTSSDKTPRDGMAVSMVEE